MKVSPRGESNPLTYRLQVGCAAIAPLGHAARAAGRSAPGALLYPDRYVCYYRDVQPGKSTIPPSRGRGPAAAFAWGEKKVLTTLQRFGMLEIRG